MIKIITDQSDNVVKVAKNLMDEIEKLNSYISHLKKELEQKDMLAIRENPYIAKRMMMLIATGVEKYDAAVLTAGKFGCRVERVLAIYNSRKKYKTGVSLLCKKYLAQTLKKAGYSAFDIAKILKCSENHIYKLWNCNLEI